MGIRVNSLVEPLTAAAQWDRDNDSKWAQCDAYKRLKEQIRRYAKGEIAGQSILFAGHRGSGKTTMVQLAVQQVRWDIEFGRRSDDPEPPEKEVYAALPFIVPLHAPDLFGDLFGVALHAREERISQSATQLIARSLHRSFCREISNRFARSVSGGSPQEREAAEQLRVELDHTPTLAKLRAYWARARLLESGVMAKFRVGRLTRCREHIAHPKRGQGLRELVALSTAIDVVKKVGEEQESQRNDRLRARRGEESLPSGGGMSGLLGLPPSQLNRASQIATPILSLLAGAFAANTVISTLGPITAGAIGIATVLLAYSFLQKTGVAAPRHTLAPDSSVTSLDLLLPVLVDRLIDAGFAPIFVVDEMDKVEDLDDKMTPFIGRLTHFVTDRALFCFLADRSYYEWFEQDLRNAKVGLGQAYPPKETYYGERLLVYYTPEDMRSYVDTLLRRTEPKGATTADVLERYLVPSLCPWHPTDLRKAILSHVHDNSTENDAPSLWLSPGHRIAAQVQISLESEFRNRDVKRVLQQNRRLTPWLADALYGRVRAWRRGEFTDSSTIESLESELTKYATTGELGQDGPAIPLDDFDKRFIFKGVQRFMRGLAFPASIAPTVYEAEDDFQGACIALAPPVIEGRGDGKPYWTWLVDQYCGAQQGGEDYNFIDRWRKGVVADSVRETFEARASVLLRLRDILREELGTGLLELTTWPNGLNPDTEIDACLGCDGVSFSLFVRDWKEKYRPQHASLARIERHLVDNWSRLFLILAVAVRMGEEKSTRLRRAANSLSEFEGAPRLWAEKRLKGKGKGFSDDLGTLQRQLKRLSSRFDHESLRYLRVEP